MVCLAGCVGLNEGLSSNIFAVAFIVSLIVMYDASGVRLYAGKQATVRHVRVGEGARRELSGRVELPGSHGRWKRPCPSNKT